MGSVTPLARCAGWISALGILAACGGAPLSDEAAGSDQPAASIASPVTVYLVRHAEKVVSEDPDPPLTAQGAARGAALADALGELPIGTVIASQFRRTQQTVEPLAEKLGTRVEVVDAAAGDLLAERLRGGAPGTLTVVAGHSNTIPALIAALGVDELIEIPDDRYGDLFVVRMTEADVTLERRRFGD
jgi:broad specificity phosphatase PhoE